MSIWTSKTKRRGAVTLAALLFLSACVDGGGGFARAPSQMAVAGGSVIIAGPRDYCVDRRASQPEAGFVLMGGCASVSGAASQPQPRVPAVLMASVSGPGAGTPVAQSLGEMESFFTSEAGRAALSQSGSAETVRVLETRSADGVFYIHARDQSEGLAEAVRDEYWRALFELRGRLVSASVFGTDARPFSSDAGHATLRAFVSALRAANPES